MVLPTKDSEKATRQTALLISLLLILVTTVLYWQVREFDFVNYDDTKYIVDNPHIQNGISFDSIIWAFTTQYFSNWHPLTWLSYLLDFKAFGLWAGGYHLVNLFFHICNTLLLFFVFRKMTGQIWQSGFLAALFALHPLHVESVAWISERKDMLSAFFWLLSIWAYIRYVRRPLWHRYLWVVVLFILGLMSKPMVVTLPFVLLLLDFWPLRRLELDIPETKFYLKIAGLIREKIPMFLLAAASAGITFYAQHQGGAVQSFDVLPLSDRLITAVTSYVIYIIKTVYPVKLVVFYPYLVEISWWNSIVAIMTLASLTGLAIKLLHRDSYIIIGWLWFLGTMVPVIGLVQVGGQSMADRYMYLPMIGLLIIIAWGIPDLLAYSRYKRAMVGLLAIITISIISTITWTQVGYWRNSTTLFSHAIGIMPDNVLARNKLGEALSKKGELIQAIPHYEFVLKQNPWNHDALINLGLTLLNMEKPSDATVYFNRVLEISPDDPQALRLSGYAMAAMGNYEQAIQYYVQALKKDQTNAELHFFIGVAYNALTKQSMAVHHYQKAIELKPDDTLASLNLGNIYYRSGRMDLAGKIYLFAFHHEPNNPDVLSKLGAVALSLGQTDRALNFFNQALQIRPDHRESQKGLEVILQKMQNKKE